MVKQLVGFVLFVFVLGITPMQAQYAPEASVSDSTYIYSHSPHKATFYSVVLPGLGQIYNQKYWKVPILYAGLGGLIYYADYNNFVYKKYYEQYRQKLNYEYGTIDEDPYPGVSLEQLNSQKDTWRRYRDLCFIGMGILYVAQIIDADVDAHLFDYDISEDLSMRLEPIIMDPYTQVSIRQTDIPIGLRCSIRF